MFWDGTRWVTDFPAPPTPQRRRLRDWLATIPIILLLPALLSPFMSTGAASAPELTVHGSAVPGGTIRVTGEGFPDRTRIQLEWNDSASGMPSVRTNSKSQLSVDVEIPSSTKPGTHVLSAVGQGKPGKGGTAGNQQNGKTSPTPDEPATGLLASVEGFAGTAEWSDDATLVAIERPKASD